MLSNRELLQWRWPQYRLLLPLDVLLSTAIVGTVIAMVASIYPEYVFRTRMTEAWVVAGNQRLELIERLALSGESVSAAPKEMATPTPTPTTLEKPRRQEARLDGNTIVVRGNLESLGGRGEYEFAMKPATQALEVPSVYIWLCDAQAPPSGWVAPVAQSQHVLPTYLLPSDCRRKNK